MEEGEKIWVLNAVRVLNVLPESDGQGTGSYLYLSGVIARAGLTLRVVEDLLWELSDLGQVEIMKDFCDDPKHPGGARLFHSKRVFARIIETEAVNDAAA